MRSLTSRAKAEWQFNLGNTGAREQRLFQERSDGRRELKTIYLLVRPLQGEDRVIENVYETEEEAEAARQAQRNGHKVIEFKLKKFV